MIASATIHIEYNEIAGWSYLVLDKSGNPIEFSYAWSTREKARQQAVKCLERYMNEQEV